MLIVKEPQLAIALFVLAFAATVQTRFNGGVALLWLASAPLLARLCRTKLAQRSFFAEVQHPHTTSIVL